MVALAGLVPLPRAFPCPGFLVCLPPFLPLDRSTLNGIARTSAQTPFQKPAPCVSTFNLESAETEIM